MCCGKATHLFCQNKWHHQRGKIHPHHQRFHSITILILPAMRCFAIWQKQAIRRFADGKMIFLSGSPELERIGGIPTGRLSGIVNHHVPKYLRSNQLPSYETNCIEDWETKLIRSLRKPLTEDMTLISGIPPWMQMYFDRLIEKAGKKIGESVPNFSVMVQGGVNFEPYKANCRKHWQ